MVDEGGRLDYKINRERDSTEFVNIKIRLGGIKSVNKVFIKTFVDRELSVIFAPMMCQGPYLSRDSTPKSQTD